MSFFARAKKEAVANATATPSQPTAKRRWWRIVAFFGVLFLIAGGAFFLKAGSVLNKISLNRDGFFKDVVKSLPGTKNELQGEESGRVNVLLLGMRGENVPGGSFLADTVMVFSFHPKANEGDVARASLVSIPRDLFVQVPNQNWQAKINAVYAEGEKRAPGAGGIEDMLRVTSDITGLAIPYAVAINFKGFQDLVNALGGITVTLDAPFEENLQFRGLKKRCDGVKYTVFSGEYEEKRIRRKNGTYYANPKRYPLCYERMTPQVTAELECGGSFKLPAGENLLDGEKALCYARARFQSNDFERARRQQQVIQAIRDKALSLGTLTDFGKVSAMLDSLGNNVKTNFEVWEMKRLFELSQQNSNPSLTQKVLENSEEGLLMAPPETRETGYILLPIGGNYDRIRALFQSLP